MTEKELRQYVVSVAQKYLGFNEYDGSHKKIIDIYNSQKPLPVGYKVKYNDAWCATFTSAVFVECKLTDIAPAECSCIRLINQYRKINSWVESDSYVPDVGDLVIYDWEDSGSGDNRGEADHVGMVESVTGNSIKVIEGNKSNSVSYRTLAVNGRYIRGYCCPKYASKAASYKAPASTTPSSASTSTSSASNSTSYTLVQFIKDVQKATGAKVDGIAGTETISKTVTLSAYRNRRHAAVKPVQKRLYALGYTQVGTADGIAGPKFTAAVKAYQKDKGCVVDGVITARNKTWKKLLGMI